MVVRRARLPVVLRWGTEVCRPGHGWTEGPKLDGLLPRIRYGLSASPHTPGQVMVSNKLFSSCMNIV